MPDGKLQHLVESGDTQWETAAPGGTESVQSNWNILLREHLLHAYTQKSPEWLGTQHQGRVDF